MNKKSNRLWILAAVLVLLASVLAFKLYFDRIVRVSGSVSDMYLKEVSLHAASEVDRSLIDDIEFLNTLSKTIAEEADMEAAVRAAAKAVDMQRYQRMGIALYDTGMAYNTDGDTVDCSGLSFFTAAKAGRWRRDGGYVSDAGKDLSGVYSIVCAVPYRVDGQEVGALYAVRSGEMLSAIASTELFDGEGYGIILDATGRVVFSADSPNNLFDTGNADWEYYTERLRNTIAPEIEQNRRAGETWISEVGGQKFVFTPLSVDGLYYASVLPDAFFEAQSRHVLVASVAYCALVLVVFTLFCAMLLFDRKRRQEALVRAMLNDPLTGLYNRQGFVRRIPELLALSSSDEGYAVVDVGLNKFENFNALYGYQRGDSTLYQIGALLMGECEDGRECCARLDGTRFSLLLRCDTAAQLSRRLAEVNLMISMTAPNAAIRTTYGVYRVEDKSAPPDMLIDRAYSARMQTDDKRNGVVSYYDYIMHDAEIEDAEMLATMEKAIEEHQFVVLYQPKYACADRKLAGAEALVRWALPEGATKAPERYIKLFEENGLIVQLDFYVLNDVCRLLRAQLDAGLTPQPVSVNLSRVHLYDRGTADSLLAVMAKWDIDRELLEFEMTESMMTGNMELFGEFVDRLHAAGLRVAMDDFGSGYSSLNMLKRIHIDVLKLDRLFLDEFDEKERARKVITGILDMANSLGVTTVAEGVETVDQLLFLRRSGCTLAQGFYFSRPVPEHEYNAMLENEFGSAYEPK